MTFAENDSELRVLRILESVLLFAINQKFG